MNILDLINKVEDYLTFTDEKLILYFLENMISDTKSKAVLSVYEKMGQEMMKGYADRTPQEIWIEFGFGGEIFPLDMFDLHQIMYYQVRHWLLSQTNDEEFLKVIVPMFIIKHGYKNGEKSSFHQHSPSYRDFLLNRKTQLEKVMRLKEKYAVQ